MELLMQQARNVVLEFVKLGAPRPKIIVLERHKKVGLLVGSAFCFTPEPMDRELRNAVPPTDLRDPVMG
jgi:hypothetical protein